MKSLYEQIREDREIRELIKRGNDNLGILGFTDHSEAHTVLVGETAAKILRIFGYDEHMQELARVAGFMHDIGNAVNRTRHAEYGAILSNEILRKYDISIADRIEIMTCISNHDESTGDSVDAISAALIIADKTDVRRNRVRTKEPAAFDIHDRVNYAVVSSDLELDVEKKKITLVLQIDETICSMYEYFDIFLGRMQMCRHAAEMLGARFSLKVNGNRVL